MQAAAFRVALFVLGKPRRAKLISVGIAHCGVTHIELLHFLMIEFISYILFDLGLSQMFGLNKSKCRAVLKAAECFPVAVSL